MSRKPNLFVSSTFFDLKQIRADLYDFIEMLGYHPVLSEYNSFPVSPDEDTVENCLKAVKNNADIFILIIGGRYGYKVEGGKSITNLEYRTAISKNLPIYVFVQKEIFTAHTLWKDNPSMDFSSIVDDNDVFTFFEDIYVENKKWVFSFEKAQDITKVLKVQLSYLLSEGLKIQKKLRSDIFDVHYSLSAKAYKLFYEQDDAWQILLFLQVLDDYIGSYLELRLDVQYSKGFQSKKNKELSKPKDFANWASKKISEIQVITDRLSYLLNTSLSTLHNEENYDVNKSIYLAKKITEVYAQLLKWVISVKEVEVHEDFKNYQSLLVGCVETTIKEFEDYPKRSVGLVNDILNADSIDADETVTLTLTLTLTLDNEVEMAEEFIKLEKKFL